MDHAPQPQLQRIPPDLAAASIAAFLDNQAHIIFYSSEIEARYVAMSRAGAGYHEPHLAGEAEHAWRIARAIEQLSASSPNGQATASAADLGAVGHHEGPVASSSLSSTAGMSSSAFGQPHALPPSLDQHSYGSAPSAALYDPTYLASAVASSRLDYARAMQHHLSHQFATASLHDGPAFSSPPSSSPSSFQQSGYAPGLLPPGASTGRPPDGLSHPSSVGSLAGGSYSAFLQDSPVQMQATIPGLSIAPPLPLGVAGPSSLGGASTLGTVQESPTYPTDAPYTCVDSPPSYDTSLPDRPSASTSGASTSRAFSVPAGIKPEAAAAHHAWNASLNALDPDKKFICPIPSCGRGFKRIFNLKAHMNSHAPEGGKRFPCTVEGCLKGFSRKHDMERHRTAAHPDIVIAASTTVEGRMRVSQESRSKTL